MRRRRLLGAQVAATMGRDPDLAAWMAAVVTNGGTVSAGRAAIVGQFIAAEKAAGCWALTDDYSVLWGENAQQALTSLKQRRLATAVNAPTFTPDRDYTFDGVANYINTGFICSTHAVAMTGSNMRIANYSRGPSASSTGYNAGVSDSSSSRILIRNLNTTAATFGLNSGSQTVAGVGSSQGYISASRTAASVFEMFRNGVSFGTAVPTPIGTTLPATPLFIGALNNLGSPSNYRACQLGLVVVGASLTANQELAQYNNVQAFATAVGAQV